MTKKAIGATEFNVLSKEQQMRMLYNNGVYIGKRLVNQQKLVLFQLYGFYVEVHYKQYRKEVESLIISDQTEIIIPYLNQIDIRSLNIDSEIG